jgi:hypothetical protein
MWGMEDWFHLLEDLLGVVVWEGLVVGLLEELLCYLEEVVGLVEAEMRTEPLK